MKKHKGLFSVMIILILLLNGCGKDDNPTNPNEGNKTGTFTDSRDNHVYKWVKIGDQTWMAENLTYKPSSGKYWAYDNNENNAATYGYLYDWETAKTIAPTGWHLPSQSEWETLVNSLGGKNKAYTKLLESGTQHWGTPNNATNETGFTALPGGYFDQRDNSFNFLGHLTMFHSTTTNTGSIISLTINRNFKTAVIEGKPKELAVSIRCIKN